MAKTVAIYTRVSTDSQDCANQERELRAVADRAGWEVVRVYSDHGVSGAKRREARPAFKAMCDDAARRRFDMIAAWSVDRLGRSLQDLVGFLSDIQAWRVDMYLHTQAIDTSAPAGRALFSMLAVFSEFERSLIRERVMAGLARARSQGKVLGRPRMPADKTRDIQAALLSGGQSLRRIAAQHRVGLGTVQRMKASMSG
jgi:DNA invertase Pin-like site-specific DNA recombinase